MQGQVAHELLTRPPLIRGPKPSSPFDLNVLCTPPAFILSQDQTLEQIVSSLTFARQKSLSERFGSFYFFEYVFCRETEHCFFLGIFEIFALAINACTSISCCSIVNDQCFSRKPLSLLCDSLTIISQPFGFVKGVFKSF